MLDGVVYAMAGVSSNHSLVQAAITRFLVLGAKGQCLALGSDTAIRFRDTSYVFPDAIFACDPTFADEGIGFLGNPLVVFEVLSPSTSKRDRGRKAGLYRTLPTLAAYALVASDTRLVEIYGRVALGNTPGADEWRSILLA